MANVRERVKAVNVIATPEDHREAVERLAGLMAAGNPEDDHEIEALGLLIENYERKTFDIALPDPIDAIQFRMATLGIDQADVARMTDIRPSHVSEFINRRRPLSLDAIRRFHDRLNVPIEVLVQPYSIRQPAYDDD